LAAAESAGFDAMISADRDIRKIALIELTTTHCETIRENFLEVRAAITDAKVGSYAMLALPRPPRLRRPCPRPA
jgi:hypothetical protein